MKHLNRMRRSGKDGTTLTEMCVVLAVISIVALAVVSFTTMVGARSAVGAAKLNMLEDRQLTKVVLSTWVDTLAAEDATFMTDENGNIFAAADGGVFSVFLGPDSITAPVPSGQMLSCPISTLTSLKFEQMTNSDGDAIFFCTAAYELPNPAGGIIERSFTFTINPHIGDVYEEVGA